MPFGRGIGLGRFADRGPGVVDQDVEPAEPLFRVLDYRPAGALVGHIQRNESALRPEFGHRRGGLLGVARGHYDAGPGSGEPARHAEPDPAIAAGNDGDASG